LKKEEVRSLEGEKDKDEDSSAETSDSAILPVDLPSVRRAYSALFKLKTSIFEHSLVNALVTLAGNLQMELPTRKERGNQDDVVNVLLIVFEIPALGSRRRDNRRHSPDEMCCQVPAIFWKLRSRPSAELLNGYRWKSRPSWQGYGPDPDVPA
jgi:hypothetical protein